MDPPVTDTGAESSAVKAAVTQDGHLRSVEGDDELHDARK